MQETHSTFTDSSERAGLPDFVRMPGVVRLTGLGRSTIYRLMAAHNFPDPVRLSKRAIGWRRSDLELWGKSRLEVHG